MSVTESRGAGSAPTRPPLRLTMTAAIHARFAHRVDGLVHSHPWSVEATVEGPSDAAMVMPADDLERLLHRVLEPWRELGHRVLALGLAAVEAEDLARVASREGHRAGLDAQGLAQ